MKKVSEGAEAKIYATEIFGEPVIIKDRISKAYRIKEIDNELRETRTKREAKMIYNVSRIGVNAPRLLALGRFKIYMSRIKGRLLKDTKFEGILFHKAGRVLALMHNANIVHGDYTPANIMCNGKEIFVIDFGLAEATNSVEDKAIDLLLMKRSIDDGYYKKFIQSYRKDCREFKAIIARLEQIERRGRYQVRTLA